MQKILLISTDWACKSAPSTQKTCMQRVRIPTELPFCVPPLVVGCTKSNFTDSLQQIWCLLCFSASSLSSLLLLYYRSLTSFMHNITFPPLPPSSSSPFIVCQCPPQVPNPILLLLFLLLMTMQIGNAIVLVDGNHQTHPSTHPLFFLPLSSISKSS